MRKKDSILKPSTSKASRGYSMSLKGRATKSVLLNIAEPFVTIPPDGGWGWVVVTVSVLIMFVVDGIGFCFSLFFETISDEFHCEITEVAFVSSMMGGFNYLAGPITCSLVNRCGFQLISVVGGAVAFFSFLAASYTTSLLPFVILVGFGGGSAFNLIYTPSAIAVGFYFEKWRALATALFCCGSSLGIIGFPIIMVHVFGNMHWRTIFKILAGVLAICGLLGLTYKPIKSTRVERNVQFGDISISSYQDYNTSDTGAGGFKGLFDRFRNTLFPRISEVSVLSEDDGILGFHYMMHRRSNSDDDDQKSAQIAPDSSVDSRGNYSYSRQASTSPVTFPNVAEKYGCLKKIRKCCKCCKCYPCGPVCTKAEVSFTNVNRPLYRDDIFYSGSVFTLSEYPKLGSSRTSIPSARGIPSLAYVLSVSRAVTQRDLLQQHECVCCPEAVVRVLTTMLDLEMMKSPTFISLLISGYLSLVSMYVFFTYLVSYMISRGMDVQFSKMMLSVIGISNLVGKAACGFVSCLPILDTTLVSWVTISISGIFLLLTMFADSTTEYIIYYVIYGFTSASFTVLRAVMFVDLFGLENLTNCFGLNMVFQSLAAFSATPLANLIFRYTNTFTSLFMFSGIAQLVSGLILIPIKSLLKWEKRRSSTFL